MRKRNEEKRKEEKKGRKKKGGREKVRNKERKVHVLYIYNIV